MANEIKAWTALHLKTIPYDQTIAQPSEILVKVKSGSVNPVDNQLMGYPLLKHISSSLLRSDKGWSGFKPGDEVLGIVPFIPSGTLQETIMLDTKSSQSIVVRKPADWSWEQASAFPLVWMTGCTLVEGVVSYIKKRQVIATCSSRNADSVKGMGAAETVDYAVGGVRQRLTSFAPHAVIDCVGGTNYIGIAQRYVTAVGDKTNRMSMGGALIYLGNPRMVLCTVIGWTGLIPSYACFNLSLKPEYRQQLLRLPKEKIIVDSTHDFYHVKEAFERLNTGHARGKVVIVF
ncbi:NAD(P)-binding protein [Xylariaceae sp. FL1272]|nr:NAD(P)-binding protein [Xylariaceae sp. FL1272]